MEFKARVLCGVIVLLVSMGSLYEARWIDDTDQGTIPDINRNATLLLNESRNATTLTEASSERPNPKMKTKESELLRIIINTKENQTVVHVGIPYMKYKTIVVKRNKIVKLNFTRNMFSSFNDITSKPTPYTVSDMRMAINHIHNQQLQQYKSATIALAVLCSVVVIALAFLTLRYKAKSTSEKLDDDDTSLAVAKQTVESEYQSIRGLPRRETGNSYGYETVKPKLPTKRPSLGYLLHPNESRDYENLKPHDLENLKMYNRESNPYMSMNEALAGTCQTKSSLTGSDRTGSVVTVSGGDEDLYLTMKKLIRTTPDEMAIETNESASI